MLMNNKDNLNQQVLEAREDSGWKVKFNGKCRTTWERTFKLEKDVDIGRIIDYLYDLQDYPGMGIAFAKGYSKGDKTVIISTYDSSG